MVQKCPLFVNVYTIKMSTKEDRWSKSQNLVNVVCERPPLGAFLSFEWGNLSPYGILSILAIYQVSCFGNGKVVSPIGTVQDFLIKLDIKPLMHPVEISTLSDLQKL